MNSMTGPDPLRRKVGNLWLLVVVFASQAMAQDTLSSAAAEAPATAVARMTLEGRPVARVPVTLFPDGPRFALSPIAAALGIELRVGPLGDSHTLVFEDRQIIVGPGDALMVTVTPEGGAHREVKRLGQIPIRDAAGLKVPLQLLEAALGDPLTYQFAWAVGTLELAVTRPELRLLRGSINLVHQYQVSLVEIEFSEVPRYRIERLPGALEIHLIGDRLEMPLRTPRGRDPLVPAVVVSPGRVRLELADNAVADEPRLLRSEQPRLVIEVFERAAPRSVEVSSPRRVQTRAAGIRTIALDPGHGGSETGAIGPSGTAEADLTLLVARALKLQLERRLPVKVIVTRDQDVDVQLETRAAIANENRADLFISLHFNSSFGSKAHGAETYFLSRDASDQMAAEFAAAENKMTEQAEASELDLQMILWDLAQSYHQAESQRFANLVQEELNLTLGLRDRGVKQAPFHVLMGAKMPAVLVELGFLSNPEEEAELQSPRYRAELVDALVRAVIRFKKQIESQDLAESVDESADGQGETPGDLQ